MTWKSLPAKDPSPPQRPPNGHGTKGTKIILSTNHFEVEVKNKNLTLFHYDVAIKDYKGDEITPPLPKSKNMIIFEKLKQSFPKVFNVPLSYDSAKNAYSTTLIPQLKKPQTYEVKLEGEKKEDAKRANRSTYKVTLVKVNQASLKDLFSCMKYVPGKKKELPTTIIQMIEVMFRHYRAQKYQQISNRNFFSLDEEFAENRNIGGGKMGVTGFFGSLRPSAWKDGSILLNLDMAHTAFYEPKPLIEFMQDIDQHINVTQTIGDPRTLRNLTKALKGLKIKVEHSPRTYKIYEVHTVGPNKTSFDFTTESGTQRITVVEYFQKQYKKKLKLPYLNCINVGNQNKQVFIPAEMCRLDKGQKVKKKLSEAEVSQFIRSTAVPPAERLRQIRNVAKTNNFKADEMLKSMTFTISDMPLQTEGRVLPAPGLTMEKNNFFPSQGQWDVRSKRFHVPAELKVWAVLNYDCYKTQDNTLRKFIDRLKSMGKDKGMKIEEPFNIYTPRGGAPKPLEDLQYYKAQKPDLQMVMCVLPGRRHYGAIKVAGDTDVKIVTQCVLGQNVFKCQDQTLGNILMKINAKMGGINNIVTITPTDPGLMNFKEPFLIMGADVNHPPAGGDSGIPSIAAVVGSLDRNATKYAVERHAQYHREEIISNMKEITVNLLKTFFKNSGGRKPSRIVMFRDGVSESQFSIVLAREMLAMREACKVLQADGMYQPGITFICVQKRHHTRLFCDERYVQNSKNKNVPPGTIVDRDITHPTETDFFLCSHQGIQGTSKPTHYHLLWDDNDIPIDELQALTYKLCHVYSRCSRSVSIPTPVYYAHLAAFRAKVYVTELLGNGSETGSVASGAAGEMDNLKVEIVRVARSSCMEDAYGTKLHYI